MEWQLKEKDAQVIQLEAQLQEAEHRLEAVRAGRSRTFTVNEVERELGLDS